MNVTEVPRRNSARILRSQSFLLVVDIQGRLAPAIAGIDALVARTAALIAAAQRLDVPVLFTEQYPKGIGHTVESLRQLAPEAQVLEKIHFDALAEDGAVERLAATGRNLAVVVGTEAHVCVMQTCFGLLDNGFSVALVTDAVGSRRAEDRLMAIGRLQSCGATAVTTEMVLFEWLERADNDDFRAVLPSIRDLGSSTG